MKTYLLGRASTGKLRQVCVEFHEDWDEEHKGLLITRDYGQVGGKITHAPDIWITIGKAGRTHREQALLQFNHLVKEYTDKAYKIIDKSPDEYTLDELSEIYGEVKMRGDTVKPMLAKQESAVTNRKIFEDREWYGSRKVNGVRCLIFYDGKNVRTVSRGATNYDLAINHIIAHPLVVKFFQTHNDAILDGEIYKAGLSLNFISGICRSQKTVDDGKDLEFYWYDIADLEHSFTDRFKIMQEWAKELELTEFDPERHLSEDKLHIQFLPQVSIKGFDNMKKLHDKYVEEGWEGLVVRQAKSKYKPGARTNDWIKIKIYIDAEYPIVGIADGLREEDMCFILETPNGQRFNCKPMGDREQKHWYYEHIDELIGKQLTIKYFEMSGVEGSEVPQQPIGIAIRDYE
jgi:ATP-dependent DNA ligase